MINQNPNAYDQPYSLAGRARMVNQQMPIANARPGGQTPVSYQPITQQQGPGMGGFDAWLNNTYGTTGTSEGYDKLLGEYAKYSGINASQWQGDSTRKRLEKDILNTNISASSAAADKAKQADIAQYQALAPLAQQKLLGSLNARGLGSSVMAGGSGTGYMSSLANQQMQGLGNIEQNYQDLQQGLAARKQAGKYDINGFYNDLGNARTKAAAQGGGLMDWLGGAVGAMGALI